MTEKSDLKKRIRDRQQRTGESFTTARLHVMRARAELLGVPHENETTVVTRAEAIVLKVNDHSARVRVLGEEGQITFRSADAWNVVPGHVVTLTIERRWTWHGDEYASGRIERPRIDVAKLALEPLPLDGGDSRDLREGRDPYRRRDPYAPLWRKLTAKPRASFEFDGIAWGAFPGDDPDDNPTCDAAELVERGDIDGARALLMDTLLRDLRCLDAHAHLGNCEFDRSPLRALPHYEIGMRIGELSLPRDFDGVLEWGLIYNRPFLRCMHGYALCLWRLGRYTEAEAQFERLLHLDPDDALGARFCWSAVRAGRPWEDFENGDPEGDSALH